MIPRLGIGSENAMNKKRVSKFLIILLIFATLATLTTIAAESSSDSDRSYSIPLVIKNINISSDGTTHIQEHVNYVFSGTYNGVYRDIPISGEQSVENITVETPGLYNKVTVENQTNNVHIKVYLYKDAQETQPVSDQKAEIIYNYDFLKGVKVYNDIAEFQYMAWGSEWEVGVDKLQTNIMIPGNNQQTETWINPPFLSSSNSWKTNNLLETTMKPLGSYENVEIRMLMPKSYFDTNATNVDRIQKDAKAQIEQDQKAYVDNINFNQNLTLLLTLLSIIVFLIPFGIYFKYGREPKIAYNAKYETDLPTKDSPAFVNAIMQSNMDDMNIDAFQATILDLIDRGYIKVVTQVDDDTLIKITNKDGSDLKKYETEIINYFTHYEDDDGVISIKRIGAVQDPLKFQKFYKLWKNDASNEVLPSERVNQLFSYTGSSLFSTFAKLGIIYAILVIIYIFTINPWVPNANTAFDMTALIIPEAIIMFFLPNKIGGQWTYEGREMHDKWESFGNYIKDYSLIKDYPPASIQVWGRYLVYAVALGDAEKVHDNMKKFMETENVPDDYMQYSDTALFSYYGGNLLLYNTLSSAATYTPPSESSGDFGSFGDIGGAGGGGFGGGGGGAF